MKICESLSVGTTRDHETRPRDRRSWWLSELPGREAREALSGRISCDVCVVGGGFAGLWTAIWARELDPSCEVVLLEADTCGGGASGRNGGLALSWWSKFLSLEKIVGTDEAQRLCQATTEFSDQLAARWPLAAEQSRMRRAGWAWVSSNQAQVGAWNAVRGRLQNLGLDPFVPIDAARTNDLRSPACRAGLFEPSGATLQPAALATALLTVAEELGVRVFERSRVQRTDQGGRVFTANGSVDAEQVVIAVGAWAGALCRTARRSVVVVGSDMFVSDRLAADAGPVPGLAVSDSRLMVRYFHKTPDGRLAFGVGGGSLSFGRAPGRRFTGPSGRESEIRSAVEQMYPGVSPKFAQTWNGGVDRSVSGIPFLAPWRGGRVYTLAGFSGSGVTSSQVLGRIAASRVLGREDAWARSRLIGVPDRFPPEPARYLGGRVVRRAVERLELAHDSGRRPDPISRRLASLAPKGLVPTSTN